MLFVTFIINEGEGVAICSFMIKVAILLVFARGFYPIELTGILECSSHSLIHPTVLILKIDVM